MNGAGKYQMAMANGRIQAGGFAAAYVPSTISSAACGAAASSAARKASLEACPSTSR